MEEKKRVLIICNMDLVLYNFRKEIVHRLLSEGYEVYITFPKGDRVEYFENLGCKFIETKVDRRGINPIKDLKLLKSYNKIMKEIKPNMVLTFTIKPNIYGGMIARHNKIPYIANITGLGSALENKGIIQKITVMLYKIAFKKIKKVFLQNEENMQFFIDKNIAKEKLKLIPGSGVNLSEFTVFEYPEENKPLEFLFLARVMKEKGIEEYIEMATRIKKKYKDVKFHILGFCEEQYQERLKKLQEENIVQYHGMQKDIRPFIEKSHCTIHPSFYPEGISNVLLESAACGRPVITTNRSGCRETVDDGINGYIVPIKDVDKLTEKVEQFINLPYEDKKKMGLAGRKKVEKEFDRNIVVNAYMKEIKK